MSQVYSFETFKNTELEPVTHSTPNYFQLPDECECNTATIMSNILYSFNDCLGYASEYRVEIQKKSISRSFHLQTPREFEFMKRMEGILQTLHYTKQAERQWIGETDCVSITISYCERECSAPDSVYELTITLTEK